LDENNKLTSFLRDGKKEATQEVKDVNGSISRAKPISHSMLL
jgi:hypothetical protein